VGQNDSSSRKRAGRRVRQELRREARAAMRANAARLTTYLLVYLVACVGIFAFFRWAASPGHGWFFAGLAIGAIPAFHAYFLTAQGIAHRQMGGDAEEWTAQELKALDRRTWRVFHDVPVRYGNVDHVAVGPGRVYAIETKWTSAGVRYLDQLASSAERQAKRLQAELRARGTAREVVPLMVLWGPGLADELGEQPRMEGSTRVVAGRHSSVWLQRMAAAADGLEVDLPAAHAVEALILEEGSDGSASTR
jgi:hypothetical protein